MNPEILFIQKFEQLKNAQNGSQQTFILMHILELCHIFKFSPLKILEDYFSHYQLPEQTEQLSEQNPAPFICSVCSKEFASIKALNGHKRVCK